MRDTCAPLLPSPIQSCCPTKPPIPTTTLWQLPSPKPLDPPSPFPFPFPHLSPSLPPQPSPSLPHLFSGSPRLLPPQNLFCSWLRVLHVRLRAGRVGLEDTLPFIRGPTEWAYFSHLRNPLCFLPEKWAEASLWNLAGGMSLSKRPPLSLQTSQSRPSLPCSFVGMEREWNLTSKVKRAGENTRDGPTLLPTKA